MNVSQALLNAYTLTDIDRLIDRELGPAKQKKKCLMCKKEHTHNNSFCSPEYCKRYKP